MQATRADDVETKHTTREQAIKLRTGSTPFAIQTEARSAILFLATSHNVTPTIIGYFSSASELSSSKGLTPPAPFRTMPPVPPALHFCHECNMEMRPLMEPNPTCPNCGSEFVEEVGARV